MKTLVIGFAGKRGSGKTTWAKHVTSNYKGEVVAFADPLKKFCQAVWGWTHEELWGEDKERFCELWKMTPRDSMQRAGHGARNVFGENFWVDQLWHQIDTLSGWNGLKLVVVEDVRYVNEAKSLIVRDRTPDSLYSCKLIKLYPNHEQEQDCYSTHPSEAEIDKIPDEWVDLKLVNSFAPGGKKSVERVLDAQVQKWLDQIS